MKKIFIFLIRAYQKYISPFKGPSCRFQPTCSQYAIEAFEKRGVLMGMLLTAYRLLRCNPLCKGGYDPVPEPKRKIKVKKQTDAGTDSGESETNQF
ncbi:MAG TPA: membrane protein insertion efficiency factor YidD [Bacillota bacterium]|nr:membrane protein insertion efficiency factor YidD [Bacillota bacterium]HOK69263.1 membrane protein insertion efficiency factor YidD [Bacillota bacterium]HPP85435.1 membrane protein insertion efficiency factor YidD [Bacillota bacterium]